jgi:hypothetical protein
MDMPNGPLDVLATAFGIHGLTALVIIAAGASLTGAAT